MIVLYREEENAAADNIQEQLEELVLAHRVELVDGRHPKEVPPHLDLPVLIEGDDVYSGAAIERFLELRNNRLKISRQMSADACFVDPDDPSQCI